MGKGQTPKQLAKFLAYILGRRPDEFGLVPDDNGFVKIKDLIKAVCEEDGWRYVRRAHLNEIVLTLNKPTVEIAETRIRAKDRSRLAVPKPADNLPKLLYTCVRKRAHPHVLKEGLFASDSGRFTLSASREMARRIGRRSDGKPVLLTVQVRLCEEKGVVFFTAGEALFTADFIPLGGFTGPPLPKETPEATKKPPPAVQKKPGSFTMKQMPEKEKVKKSGKKRRTKEIAWKKGRRQLKKQFDNSNLS